MFESATLKLTGWYLLILMGLSIIFSLSIYNIASIEVNNRLGNLQETYEDAAGKRYFIPSNVRLPDFNAVRILQSEAANQTLTQRLIAINLFIFFAGGAGCYFLARRSLRPIQEAHEAQSRFVSDASHELKTPLAVMKAELEVALRDSRLDITEAKEILASNLEEVNKLSALSATLLQLSRLEHGNLDKETVSFNHLVKEVVDEFDTTHTRIQLILSRKSHSVYVNRVSIEELMRILIDNALKYSPSDSLITIRTSNLGKNVKFEITNTGEGISEKDLPYIFDRFYRADVSRTKNNKNTGHGLGLALAKRIIELHNGDLTVSSAPGQTTTLIFQLEIADKLNQAQN